MTHDRALWIAGLTNEALVLAIIWVMVEKSAWASGHRRARDRVRGRRHRCDRPNPRQPRPSWSPSHSRPVRNRAGRIARFGGEDGAPEPDLASSGGFISGHATPVTILRKPLG